MEERRHVSHLLWFLRVFVVLGFAALFPVSCYFLRGMTLTPPVPTASSSSFDVPHPQLSFSEANPVLARLNRSQIISLEVEWKEWHKASFSRAQQLSVALSHGVSIGEYRFYPPQLPHLEVDVCGNNKPWLADTVRYIATVDSLLPCPSLSIFGSTKTAGIRGNGSVKGTPFSRRKLFGVQLRL